MLTRQRHRSSVSRKYSTISRSTFERVPPIHVVPRMPREKENTGSVVLLCACCDGPCIDNRVQCCVCIKTYHYQCLYELDDETDHSYLLPSLRKKDKNCSECEDLTRLLTGDEIHSLIDTFEQIDRDKNGFITLKDFLIFCSSGKKIDNLKLFTSYNIEVEKVHFSLMDSKQKENVFWLDFQRFYSCKLIATKNKIQLTTKLSEKELIFAKRLFLKDPHLSFDNKRNLIITKDYFDQISYDLIVIIKKKYGANYIDGILYENLNIDETIEKVAVITWEDFLCQIAVPIILIRSNYQIKNIQTYFVSIPQHLPETTIDTPYIYLTKNVPTTPVITISLDLLFRKHRKNLEKVKRRQSESLSDWSIMENIEEKGILDLPKLKADGRDERQTISEPWSVVKQMEHIRNVPILVTTTTSIQRSKNQCSSSIATNLKI